MIPEVKDFFDRFRDAVVESARSLTDPQYKERLAARQERLEAVKRLTEYPEWSAFLADVQERRASQVTILLNSRAVDIEAITGAQREIAIYDWILSLKGE